ncbi:MAG: geranylgeranyl reductase family protein [Anaerolineae bacterium]|nr:geranylgeranyl reductase family protein [Anaerolineae bacterium]
MIYDAIVVGSGPGGAVAAATLAERGKSVLLIDRQAFPRDKVCGDGLPGNVSEMLDKDLGIDPKKAGLKHQQIYGISMVAPSGKSLLVQGKPSQHYSMVSPRYHFDQMLHEHALKKGAKFEVMDIDAPLYSPDGSKVIGVVQRKGKELIEHETRVVIAADGVSSSIARSLRGRVSDPVETAVAIRAYAKLKRPLSSDPTVYFKYLLQLTPGYAWIFPTAPNEVNVGLGLFDQEIYKKRGKNLKQLLNEFKDEMESEYPMEIDADTLKSWPIPVWMNRESRVVKGAYLVGDAGRFVDALTGGGIFPAMITGQLAARSAIQILDGGNEQAAASAYDEGWRNGIGRSLNRLLMVQKWIGSKPPVFNAIFGVANAIPPIRSALLTGLAGQHS